jgi:ABC-type amino acid transport system permease subunit
MRKLSFLQPTLPVLFLVTLGFTSRVFAQNNRDESAFRLALKNFQAAVLHNNFAKAGSILHFPLSTAKADQGYGRELPADSISETEFERYKNAIFNQDVCRILPKLGNQAIRGLKGNEDSYYIALSKAIDQGSRMYELYAQYPARGEGSESYFAFVFAKIKGRYKVVAYYSKWPLR